MTTMKVNVGDFLYRGNVTEEKECPPDAWLTDSHTSAETYGDANKFRVISEISVLNMADPKNIEMLSRVYKGYAAANDTHPLIFDHMYSLQEDGSVHRYSQYVADTVIVHFFKDCQKRGIVDPSLDGFGAEAMLPSHHWEVFLNHAADLMELVTCVPISPTKKQYMRMSRADAISRKNSKNNRKRRRMRPSTLQF